MYKNERHPLDISLEFSINGEFEKSEEILKSLPKDDARVIFNLGWHKMRRRNLQSAFECLNVGRFIDVFGNPPIPGKIWKDEPLDNKTLLFRCEGGYGDQILNFRFAKKFQEMGARVIVSCSSELKELFSRHGFICINNDVEENVYYDYWIPAMSAPYILGMEYDDIDGGQFIYPSNKFSIYSKKEKLKVGIRWSGNPKFEHHQYRKFPPEFIIDLHEVPNTSFYSLQRDNDLIDGLPFADMKDRMKSWEDTANIISDLDLVITSCTSIAHLSGAMGIPTWVIVPILPYYTWSVPGKKSKWYDSVTLFRQTEFGKWDDVFEEVKHELTKLSCKNP